MKKTIRLAGLLGIAALTLFAAGGCSIMREALEAGAASDNPNDDNFRPRFVVGVFSIVRYPRATELEREIETPDGRTVSINTNQNFSSKNLKRVRVVARPGNPDVCDLQFQLDRAGLLQWEMLAGRHREEPMVFVVDGRCEALFYPELPPDDGSDWVTLRVGVNPHTAKGVAKYAEKNYTHYNPDSSSWFNYL